MEIDELKDTSKTLEEWLHHHLYSRGLFHDEADKIIGQMKEADPEADYWRKDKDSYPEPLKAVLRVSASKLVLEWMVAECPKHWAMEIFVGIIHLNGDSEKLPDPKDAAAEALTNLIGSVSVPIGNKSND